MIKLINFITEGEIGQTDISPETGIKTTLSAIDPETGKYSWDVDYSVDPKFIYDKLDKLVSYMDKVDDKSDLGKIKEILKNLKNKTHRMIK
jgi:hypothetical protein